MKSPRSLGASGATFGYLGAAAYFFYTHREEYGRYASASKCMSIAPIHNP
jgi:membrane associated rhomboid family serine protease